jgi:hypothetical protein
MNMNGAIRTGGYLRPTVKGLQNRTNLSEATFVQNRRTKFHAATGIWLANPYGAVVVVPPRMGLHL